MKTRLIFTSSSLTRTGDDILLKMILIEPVVKILLVKTISAVVLVFQAQFVSSTRH